MQHASLATLATLILLAGTAQAQSVQQKTVNTNADGTTVTRTTTTYYYQVPDLTSGSLGTQDFNQYVYSRWDLNHDGFVTPDEWQGSITRWYRYEPAQTQYKTYNYWDQNGDGKIDPSEFGTVLTTTSLYRNWDKNGDGVIDGSEYDQASFYLNDLDNDGMLSPDEWTRYR